jgi:hypothetical protein
MLPTALVRLIVSLPSRGGAAVPAAFLALAAVLALAALLVLVALLVLTASLR